MAQYDNESSDEEIFYECSEKNNESADITNKAEVKGHTESDTLVQSELDPTSSHLEEIKLFIIQTKVTTGETVEDSTETDHDLTNISNETNGDLGKSTVAEGDHKIADVLGDNPVGDNIENGSPLVKSDSGDGSAITGQEKERNASGYIAKEVLSKTSEFDPVSGMSSLNLDSEEQSKKETDEGASGGMDSDDEISEDDITLTEEQIEERKIDSKKLKDEGNEFYKNGEFTEAERLYTEGLKICPKCLEKERSVMYSNRSACYVKMDNTESAIEDCTKAIDLHPTYLKAILRRAQLYEKLEKFEEALKDYETVLQMDPSIHVARAACLRLPSEIEKRNEKLKTQMMSSLKDLGNMFLKPFGLSTTNFEMQQDPSTGSYNVQFNNGSGGNGKPKNDPNGGS